MDDKLAAAELHKRYGEAEALLHDADKMERFLQRLEKKLREIPELGETLAAIPVFASMVKNYVTRAYTNVPFGTIVAIVAALIYFVSPVDIVPDVIPGVGYIDDAAVVAACLLLVKVDLEEYEAWRRETGRALTL